jgi:hypothetical protein
MSRFYPEINENNLKLIKQLFEEDKTFFDDDTCPYSDTTIALFKNSPTDISDFENEDALDIDNIGSTEYIIKEINALYTHLQQFGKTMRDSDTASEKNTYFKLSAALLERLISMKERMSNVAKVTEFTETVLQILDEEVNVDERTKIIERLRNVTLN